MKINLSKRTIFISGAAFLLLAVLIVLLIVKKQGAQYGEDPTTEEEIVNLLYGIPSDKYNVEDGAISSGQTMGQLLGSYGLSMTDVDRIGRAADSVFSFRKIRAGNNYCVFTTLDSIPKLDYFIYEVSATDFFVLDLTDSLPRIYLDQKAVTLNRVTKEAEITSSFWNAMVDAGMKPALAQELSDIYAWTIDFFAIQKGDRFRVVYDERYVDSTLIGVGNVWGAWFDHGGKRYYAIPFIQDGKLAFWDEAGKSLRKNFLKAPLNFTRISSRFSNGRMHPILRIVRPHHGVDYAAPSGTPVVAIGDGTVIFKGWTNGGGNTIKIRHTTGNLISSYMHLKGYGKGITQGGRIRQGELIGYVGSTGLSTGPHLDFRVYRGNTAIDPLKIPTEPSEPIHETNKPAFDDIRSRIISELEGTLAADSLRVTTLEAMPKTEAPVVSETQNPNQNQSQKRI